MGTVRASAELVHHDVHHVDRRHLPPGGGTSFQMISRATQCLLLQTDAYTLMQKPKTLTFFGTLLALVLSLPAGCVLEAEEHFADVDDAVEELRPNGGTLELSPTAGCTLRAFAPFRGTRSINGTTYDAVIGRATVACPSRRGIGVAALLWFGDGTYAGQSEASCVSTSCSAEVWTPYTPGTWATEGVSGQAWPDSVLSDPRAL